MPGAIETDINRSDWSDPQKRAYLSRLAFWDSRYLIVNLWPRPRKQYK
jgi:hypothetical protein